MQPQIGQQDPEQGWRSEDSIAGVSTHRLAGWSGRTQLLQGNQRNNSLGLALIAIGLLIPFLRIIPDRDLINAGMILLTLASGFLFLAFWRRIYWLLLPGCILAGLSVGVPFAELTMGVSVVWGLATAFLAIHLIGQRLFNVRSRWPFIPALPLLIVGLIIAIVNLPIFFASSLMSLPLLLIGTGLYLGWGRATR